MLPGDDPREAPTGSANVIAFAGLAIAEFRDSRRRFWPPKRSSIPARDPLNEEQLADKLRRRNVSSLISRSRLSLLPGVHCSRPGWVRDCHCLVRTIVRG